MQVVFGRGDEFFASDNNGKLEYKEPELEKKEPTNEELIEKRALRRSRTISFMRPRSDDSQKSGFFDLESPSSSRRSSLINGRPPSLVLSTRSNSDASLKSFHAQPVSRPPIVSHSRLSSESSLDTQIWSHPSSDRTTESTISPPDPENNKDTELFDEERPKAIVSITTTAHSTRRLRPLSMSFKPGLIHRIPEGKQMPTSPPSPTPPLPLVPPLSQVSIPSNEPVAALCTSKSEPVASLLIASETTHRNGERLLDQTPFTSSNFSPSQRSETRQSSINTTAGSDDERSMSPIEVSNTTDRNLSLSRAPARLSLQTVITTAVISPVSPVTPSIERAHGKLPPLAIQIFGTAVQTIPIPPIFPAFPRVAPPPPTLSIQFSAVTTAPIALPSNPFIATTASWKPSTSSACTQTSAPNSPLRTALRIDTTTAAPIYPHHSYSFSTSSSALDIETPKDEFEPPPVFMGRMMDYYSKPGYQLGESLFGGYRGPLLQEPQVEGELTEWEKANGRIY